MKGASGSVGGFLRLSQLFLSKLLFQTLLVLVQIELLRCILSLIGHVLGSIYAPVHLSGHMTDYMWYSNSNDDFQ
jgi:hypothetical protein